MRRRRVHPLTAAFGAVILVVAAWAVSRGLRNHFLQPDEFSFGLAGTQELVRDFWGTLLGASPVNRGPERLMALLLYLPDRLFPENTAAMFRVAHVMTALIWVSAALPAYGLARMLRLERWQALLVAALSIVTPWLVLSTTLLNVTPAYPLTTALVWAVVRAVTRPSVTGDLLVLGIAVLNGLARTGHVPFIAIAAVAVAVQVWRDRPEGVPVGAALRAYPLRFVRTHPVLVGAGAIALAAVLALGVSRIVGGQYQGAIPRDYGVDRAFDRAGMWGAMLVLGSGYIAAIIGVPWLLRQAARPTDRVAGAFAVTAVSLFVVFVAATWQAPSEERYVAVLAGLAPVAFGAAVFRREASAIGALLAGLVVLRIVSRNVTPFDEGGFSWIVLPARQFLFRFLDTRLTQAGVPEGWSAYLIVLVLAIGVAVAVAYVCSGRARVDARWAGRTALGAGVLLLVVGAAQAQYATAKWLAGPGAPNLSFEDRTFVDRAVGDATAAGFDYNPTSGEGVPFALNLALIFNRRFEGAVRLNGMPGTFSCCLPDVSLDIDPATGRLQASGPLPRYLVVPPGFKRADLTGRPAATSPALADYVLRDLGDAPRPSYAVTGADDDGWLAPGRPVTVRGFAAADGSPPACVRLGLLAPLEGPAEYRVTGPGGVQRGSLQPGERRELRLAVSPGDAALRIRATGPAVLPDGRQRAMALTDVALDCDPATATR